MNEVVNKFLLAGDKFMPEMHLRQPGFTYSVCEPFTKNKERIQKFKETGDSRYIYQNELDKTNFQHGMAYGDFKDLTRRIASAKNWKYDGYQRGLASMTVCSYHVTYAFQSEFTLKECGFNLKRVRDMIRTYSQMHRTDKYSQHSSII